MRQSSLFVIDEGLAMNINLLESLDITLRDFMQTTIPFGGKVIVILGDPRQSCTIIKKASRAQIIRTTLPHSHLWQHFQVMHLNPKHINLEPVG
jgi:hypothetical protein